MACSYNLCLPSRMAKHYFQAIQKSIRTIAPIHSLTNFVNQYEKKGKGSCGGALTMANNNLQEKHKGKEVRKNRILYCKGQDTQ